MDSESYTWDEPHETNEPCHLCGKAILTQDDEVWIKEEPYHRKCGAEEQKNTN
jgi:hypothetical protein